LLVCPSNVPLTNAESRIQIEAIEKNSKTVGKMMKKLLNEKHKKEKGKKEAKDE
jgi:hypothetical protein